ncbi:hypothetical protein, partial [Anaerorhabdus sp.]|uniref:hypothetical protein n=1 Tax=Anaerorhabdus sp. TaxID=1872524 RepID=UPI002FC59D83
MKLLFVVMLLITVLSGCSKNVKKEEVAMNQPVVTEVSEQDGNDDERYVPQFLYEISTDPIEYMSVNHSIEEVEENVFMIPIELTSREFINFNTYSKITTVQGSNRKFYSLVFDFKNLPLTTDKCIYTYGQGINNKENCSNFEFLIDDSVAKNSFYTFSSNLLFEMNEEYWNNQHLFLTQDHSKAFMDVFTYDVILKYLDSMTE